MESHIARPITSQTTLRLASIDALRGLAVLLMMIQHIVFWVCSEPRSSLLIQFVGALGGLAAPLFISLAGVSVTLMTYHRNQIDHTLVIRGLIIIAYGYLLNGSTPHWFSMGSWYILHMIGAALVSGSLLRRASDRTLMVMTTAVLLVTGVLQNSLETPFRLFNKQMAAPVDLIGVLRYSLVEGYFPIFPWIAFFMTGLLAGRWHQRGRPEKIWRFGALLLAAMLILASVYIWGFEFAHTAPWVRYFRIQASFFSAQTPVCLLLIALSLFFIAGFLRLEDRYMFCRSHVLVCLGRTSLTFLIVHVAILREAAVLTKFWRSLSAFATVCVTMAILAIFSLAARLWQRKDYKYGFEWLLRALPIANQTGLERKSG